MIYNDASKSKEQLDPKSRMYTWLIPDGFVASCSNPPADGCQPHEAIAILNENDVDVPILVDVFFADKSPILALPFSVGAQRSSRIIIGDDYDAIHGAERISLPYNTPYSLRIRAYRRIAVQFTRVDTRAGSIALMTTAIAPDAE